MAGKPQKNRFPADNFTLMDKYEQHAIDTLPYGYVYLGRGGTFKTDGARHQGYCILLGEGDRWERHMGKSIFLGEGDRWSYGTYKCTDPEMSYAVTVGSALALLNREGSKSDKEPTLFPSDADERKTYPVGTFIKDYFPHAIAALAKHSYEAQQQHGDPLNGACMEWLKDKSIGDGNQLIRHFMEGDLESTAWRSLELLERELTKETK